MRRRDLRSQWIQQINAGSREHGLKYQQLVHGLNIAEVKLDRKSLSELAKNEPLSFRQIVAVAKSALASNYDKTNQDETKAAQ